MFESALILFGSWALTFITGLGVFADRSWLLGLIPHFRPQLAVAALVIGIGALMVSAWHPAILSFVVLAVNAMPVLPYLYPSAAKSDGHPLLVIMALNLLHTATKPERLKALIDRVSPDLLVLTELPQDHRSLIAFVGAAFPHRYVNGSNTAQDVAVLSRLPIAAAETDRNAGAPIVQLDLMHPAAGSVRLIALHPFWPIGKLDRLQRSQLEAVIQLAVKAGTPPVILAGDLNTTPWSPRFVRLLRGAGLKDSARARVLAATWLHPFPLIGLPIDHILVSPDIGVVQSRVHAFLGSDHRPISATLRLPIRG